MPLRIMHIAPFNTSGVPITFVKAERALGHVSRLITLGRDRRNYEEDVCLDLPFLDFWGTRLAKRFVSSPDKLSVRNELAGPTQIPKTWRPNGLAERSLVRFRETVWRSKIRRTLKQVDFWNFDVYQFDGGLEFYRDGRTVRELKRLGKKIVCCYTGSDLRTRGVIEGIDALADVCVTLEFDHLKLHPQIQHVFFPFRVEDYGVVPFEKNPKTIRIGHAPTSRTAKGSEVILNVLHGLRTHYPVEIVLIENVSHAECLRLKASCHIFIDQIGDLGYGLNSLESLAMGIPTCSCLAEGFGARYPGHPFVEINAGNLRAKLVELLENSQLRRQLHEKGRVWVSEHHDSRQVVERVHALLKLESENTRLSHKNSASDSEVTKITL